MELHKEQSNAKYQIKKYQPGCITVNTDTYYTTIVLTPDFIAEFNCSSYLQGLAHKPHIILLGAGDVNNIPPSLHSNNAGIEVMSTAAACRTYTLLTNDQRQVMAVLIP